MNKFHVDSSKLNKDESSINDDKTKTIGSNKKLTTMWRYFIGDQAFNAKTGNSKMNKNTTESVLGTVYSRKIHKITKTSRLLFIILGILSDTNVLSIINVLHNSLTLYKRVIGSKRLCPPSHRFVQCLYFIIFNSKIIMPLRIY